MYELEKITQLEKKIEKNNNPKDMIELGQIYDKLFNECSAEKYFKMAINCESIEGLFYLGNYYLKNDRLNLAEKTFKEQADKGNSEFQNGLAKVYKRQLKFDLAEKYFKLSIEQGNKNAIFNLGYMYFFIDKYDLSIEIFKQILDDPMACIIIGKSYHAKKDLENCEKYLKMAGNHSEAYSLLGLLYFEKENYEQAEKYLKISAEKDNKDSQKKLCQLYQQQKNYIAEEKYLRILANNGDVESILALTEKYMEQEKYKEALELYKRIENTSVITENYFDKIEVKYNLCKCYLQLDYFEEVEEYLKCIEEFDMCDYFSEIADIFYKKGKKEQAEKYYLLAFEKTRHMEYEIATVQRGKISYYLGKIYFEAGRFSLAEKYLKKAVKKKYNIESVMLLAETYEKQNNLGLAKKYYSEANTKEAKEKLNLIEQKENLINNL